MKKPRKGRRKQSLPQLRRAVDPKRLRGADENPEVSGFAEPRSLQLTAANCPFGQTVTGCNWKTSILSQCAWMAICNWYTKDICCKRVDQWSSAAYLLPLGGYCASPVCAGTEWFYNIMAEWVGQGTMHPTNIGEVLEGGSPFPRSRWAVETQLRNTGGPCRLLLDAMQNETYAFLKSALYYSYRPQKLTRTTTVTTTTSTTSTSTTTTTTTSTSTTDTITTTTSTTTTIAVGLAALINGSIDLTCMSPITFITDPMAKVAVQAAMAETAHCPEDWITVSLKKSVSRWLLALAERLPQVRRLISVGVKIEYLILIPANNREMITGMGALEAIMNTPLGNMSATLRRKSLQFIGAEAGIQVTNVYQPSLGVVEYFTTVTTTTTTSCYNCTMKIATAAAPARPSLHMAVVFSAAVLFWVSAARLHGG